MSNPFAYLDVVSIRMFELTSDTVDVVPILLELAISISIAMNPSKTVVLPPKGHVPALDAIALLENVDVASRNGVG